MKRSIKRRTKGCNTDFYMDGIMPNERIKGSDKTRMTKWSQREFFNELELDYKENEAMGDYKKVLCMYCRKLVKYTINERKAVRIIKEKAYDYTDLYATCDECNGIISAPNTDTVSEAEILEKYNSGLGREIVADDYRLAQVPYEGLVEDEEY